MAINLTQKFVYETDSKESLTKVLDTIVRIMFEAKPTAYTQMYVTKRADMFDDGTKWRNDINFDSNNPHGWSTPKYSHICTIGDYKCHIHNEDKIFNKHDELVSTVMQYLNNVDEGHFFQKCGDGYNSCFNQCDGSIKIGYRLNTRPDCGWDKLDVFLCHIYYGK